MLDIYIDGEPVEIQSNPNLQGLTPYQLYLLYLSRLESKGSGK
jgi:hypothetical protein|nr:MAG TPA: hypothetical protein [Caudoviricetes sp.]